MKPTAVSDIILTLGLLEYLPTDQRGNRITTVLPKCVRRAYHKLQNAEVHTYVVCTLISNNVVSIIKLKY